MGVCLCGQGEDWSHTQGCSGVALSLGVTSGGVHVTTWCQVLNPGLVHAKPMLRPLSPLPLTTGEFICLLFKNLYLSWSKR